MRLSESARDASESRNTSDGAGVRELGAMVTLLAASVLHGAAKHAEDHDEYSPPDFAAQAERAKNDVAFFQKLLSALSSERTAEDAVRILKRMGAPAVSSLLQYLEENQVPHCGHQVDTPQKACTRKYAKHALSVLPPQCAVPAASRALIRESAIPRSTNDASPFSIDLAYVLCTTPEGLKELEGHLSTQSRDRFVRAIVGGARHQLEEGGNEFFGLNNNGEKSHARWSAFLGKLKDLPGWESSVRPLEHQMNAAWEFRNARVAELKQEKK